MNNLSHLAVSNPNNNQQNNSIVLPPAHQLGTQAVNHMPAAAQAKPVSNPIAAAPQQAHHGSLLNNVPNPNNNQQNNAIILPPAHQPMTQAVNHIPAAAQSNQILAPIIGVPKQPVVPHRGSHAMNITQHSSLPNQAIRAEKQMIPAQSQQIGTSDRTHHRVIKHESHLHQGAIEVKKQRQQKATAPQKNSYLRPNIAVKPYKNSCKLTSPNYGRTKRNILKMHAEAVAAKALATQLQQEPPVQLFIQPLHAPISQNNQPQKVQNIIQETEESMILRLKNACTHHDHQQIADILLMSQPSDQWHSNILKIAMFYSLSFDNINIFKNIIENHNISTNDTLLVGEPLLISAIRYKSASCEDYLLRKNVQLGCATADETLLSVVFNQRGFQGVKEYLEKGADINQTTVTGSTTMMALIKQQQLDAQDFFDFVASGADLEIADHEGHSFFSLALCYADTDLLSLFWNKISAKHLEKGLQQSFVRQDFEQIELILTDMPVGVPEFFNILRKMAFYAVSTNAAHILNILIQKHQTPINDRNSNGQTLLTKAISAGSDKCEEYLLGLNADLTIVPPSQTLLSIVYEKQGFNGVKKYLEKGVDINQKNNQGYSTLMILISKRLLSAYDLTHFISAGADLDITDRQGLNAFRLSIACRQNVIVSSILDQSNISCLELKKGLALAQELKCDYIIKKISSKIHSKNAPTP